jgi:hypothetical protein
MNSNGNNAAQPFVAASGVWAGLAAVILGMATDTASAAASGYVGSRAGVSYGGVDSTLGEDRNGFAGELFGGLRLNDRWAIELGFVGIDSDLGEFSHSEEITQTHENRAKFRGTALSARYEVPMGELTRLHLRAGLTSMDLDYRLHYDYSIGNGSTGPIVGTGRLEQSGSGIGTVLALGIETALDEIWSVGVELQHYRGDMRLKRHLDDAGWRLAFDGSGSVQTAVLSLTANF